MRPGILRDSLPDHATLPGGAELGRSRALMIVDDDAQMLQVLSCYFERQGFHVAALCTVAAAKASFSRRKGWTLVLSDCHLPDGTGWELCRWIQRQPGTPPPCLLMSGSSDGATLWPDADILAKPFGIGDLEQRVRALLHR